jgi:hypothetical protein
VSEVRYRSVAVLEPLASLGGFGGREHGQIAHIPQYLSACAYAWGIMHYPRMLKPCGKCRSGLES